MKSASWVHGPATAALLGDAEIKVPEGYTFASAEEGGRAFLQRISYPVGPTLAGVLVPASGINWFIVLEYKEVGYIKDDTKDLNSAIMLQNLRQHLEQEQVAHGGAPTLPLMEWIVEPRYHSQEHMMEWAIGVQNNSGKIVNRGVRVLGRKGVIEGVAAHSDRMPLETIPLKQLMSGVTFNQGYAYKDFRRGDKIASVRLTDMFISDKPQEKEGVDTRVLLGLAGFVVVCGGTGGWVLRRRMLRKKALEETGTLAPPPVPVAVPVAAPSPVLPPPLPVSAHKNGVENGSAKLPPRLATRVNGKPNGHYRRRRMFNYQKYYSDLLMQVSDRAYERASLDIAVGRGSQSKNGSNGNGNGNGNGSAAHALPEDHSHRSLNNPPEQKLIASQTNLIDAQDRLIREQTRLIEEKAKLIQEKNQVLEKQAELFGNNTF